MQTANWDFYTEKWNNQGRKTYVYVTKTRVTYVVTKYSPYYSPSDMFKTKTDYLYVDCFEDYNVFHMQGGHQGQVLEPINMDSEQSRKILPVML